MDVILKLLEGSKAGTKVAIKKEKFLIGRSKKCHLCAGSNSISRRHCAITRSGSTVSIEDLGSRNGTLVNDEKIAGVVELSSGDEITVGPLKFQLTITQGISNAKRPKVKSVAEAVDRTVRTGDSSVHEDDITQWLLDGDESALTAAAKETKTIRLDDTNAIQLQKAREAEAEQEAEKEAAATTETPEQDKKNSKKKEPGKLPPASMVPDTKDSRDAAANALRNWNRRR